ncbi:2-hydroxy-3-oxopropionate reductase [Geminocystis sp. NIES-3708]|uniref:NAD(P)-dependent oxidoreductase n=1 Tax=Geminocystis sp. NIES-3708 TaxID=1615909 RepID=UPI0005FC8A99|nr:NAD(P)-dependent oxidoreductase [Geminocystis sp. NIES-3708]BAQ60764.1 2-hydroxy-3-oxopropionate reductase [Geminocystis sp. NIES-3708]
MKHKLAFLGLGVMGKAMYVNLHKSGQSIKAWNRTKNSPHVQSLPSEFQLNVVDSISEAVKDANIIFTCLGDVADVEDVFFNSEGVMKFAQSNSIIVDFSTIGSQSAQKISHKLQQKNIRFLDAPVSGGDIGARQGTLTIMVGGSLTDFQECEPYFNILGKNITYCGSAGSGQAVKLCNQVLASLHMIGVCEALKLAEKQGIDPHLVVDVCSTGAASSWALSNLAPKIIDSDYNPGFMIKHILKDLRLVKETLGENSDLPGVELAQKLFEIAAQLNQGEGYNLGTQAMMKSYINQ